MAIQFSNLTGETASNKPVASVGNSFNLSGTGLTLSDNSTSRLFVNKITSGNQVICRASSSAGSQEFLGTFTSGTPNTITVVEIRDSSTGSAIDFSGGDTVNIQLVADATYMNTLNTSALLRNKSETVTTANITGEVGTLHVCSIAGLTANRDFILPANAAVGDRVGVAITDGDDTYALRLKPDAADTINGGSAGAEWSRLLVAGEVVIFRCVTANSAWIVEYDGRIPLVCDIELTTACDGETAATFTIPTSATTPGAWTARIDNGGQAAISISRINIKRSGKYSVKATGRQKDAATTGGYFTIAVYKNAAEDLILLAQTYSSSSQPQPISSNARDLPLNAGDYIVYKYRSAEASLGLTATQCWLDICEVL